MDSERLFVSKMRWIADLVGGDADEYPLIRASGDYRHLLFDGLLSAANRDARLDLSIHVLEEPMHSSGTLVSWDSLALSPRRASEGAHTESVRPQQFEKRRVLSLMCESYSVYDVVIASANFLGGVHHGRPTKAKELRLQHLVNAAEVELVSVALPDGSMATIPAPIFPLLREIGECLVDSLSPLVGLLSDRSN